MGPTLWFSKHEKVASGVYFTPVEFDAAAPLPKTFGFLIPVQTTAKLRAGRSPQEVIRSGSIP